MTHNYVTIILRWFKRLYSAILINKNAKLNTCGRLWRDGAASLTSYSSIDRKIALLNGAQVMYYTLSQCVLYYFEICDGPWTISYLFASKRTKYIHTI